MFGKAYGNSDAELIEGCLAQNRSAQRRLYEKYAGKMFAVCRRYARDADQANDLLQEGFVTVFTKLSLYSGDGSFEGWMRKVFVNTALMSLRKNDVLKDAGDVAELRTQAPRVEDILSGLAAKDLMRLIAEMPIGFRTVFNLSVFEGFSHQEIAGKLGISEGASRSQLSRGRAWLQDRIIKLNGGRYE